MRKHLFILLVAAFIIPATNSRAQYITTVAGTPSTPGYGGDGGLATDASLYAPSDVALDQAGNLYMADFINNVIRKVDTSGIITTIAGTGFGAGDVSGGDGGYTGDGGPATDARLNGPFALAIDSVGNIFFADGYNHVVRRVSTSGTITTIAGTPTVGYSGDGGPATGAQINNPVGLAFDRAGNLYIADDHNKVIRKVDQSGTISTFAGNHTGGYSGDGGPATAASFGEPIGVAVDAIGNVYIADTGNVIRKVDTLGIISTFAGNGTPGYTGDGGPATAAQLWSPERVTVDDSNNVYISDFYNNVVRKVSASGVISTFAGDGTGGGATPTPVYGGDGGLATAAQLGFPEGVAVDHAGRVYISDRGNDIIRLVGPLDTVNTEGVAYLNNKQTALFAYPNPARSGNFTVDLASGFTEPAEMTITNVLGETVSTFRTMANRPFAVTINQPDGIYFVAAVTAHGKWNKQIEITNAK